MDDIYNFKNHHKLNFNEVLVSEYANDIQRWPEFEEHPFMAAS